MRTNLLTWGTVLGALPRIVLYRERLLAASSYFDRLRMVNEALGPHWVFRLAEIVGVDAIRANRPSWAEFYIDDCDRLHCPLDPGAPETEAFLGVKYSAMDMAFYAGMGFDGYALALQTPRLFDQRTKRIAFDRRYSFDPPAALKATLDNYDRLGHIPKEAYYSAYGTTLSALFERLEHNLAGGEGVPGEELLERLAAGCLIFMCGGHKGCNKHSTTAEEFAAQMEGLAIFSCATDVITGRTTLEDAAVSKKLVAVG